MKYETVGEAMQSEEGDRLYRRLREKFQKLFIMDSEAETRLANMVFKILNKKDDQNEKSTYD